MTKEKIFDKVKEIIAEKIERSDGKFMFLKKVAVAEPVELWARAVAVWKTCGQPKMKFVTAKSFKGCP